MEWRPSLTARELWQDGVNTSISYSTSLATQITKLWTTSCSALAKQASMRFQQWMRWLEQSPAWEDGKTPGGDGIPAEVWKHGGDNLFSRLHQLITNAWEVGFVPQAWKDASIVTIYKKSDRTRLWEL